MGKKAFKINFWKEAGVKQLSKLLETLQNIHTLQHFFQIKSGWKPFFEKKDTFNRIFIIKDF